jgi:hypothetical protein
MKLICRRAVALLRLGAVLARFDRAVQREQERRRGRERVVEQVSGPGPEHADAKRVAEGIDQQRALVPLRLVGEGRQRRCGGEGAGHAGGFAHQGAAVRIVLHAPLFTSCAAAPLCTAH